MPARPIRTLHLDDLILLVAKCLSGFTHFVILLYALHDVASTSNQSLAMGPKYLDTTTPVPIRDQAADLLQPAVIEKMKEVKSMIEGQFM